MARLRRWEQMERNREAVLAAARHVFLERGYGGASLEAIADTAGFSKGVVYSQFGSKADMFFELLERRISERAAQNERIAASARGAGGIREMITAAALDAGAEPEWAALLVEFRAHAARDPELNRRYAGMHERTVRGIASALGTIQAAAAGEAQVPLRAMAEFVLAVGAGITLERLANGAALPDEAAIDLLTGALAGAMTGLPDGPAATASASAEVPSGPAVCSGAAAVGRGRRH
jgi:AcrR family transcriptional regulator